MTRVSDERLAERIASVERALESHTMLCEVDEYQLYETDLDLRDARAELARYQSGEVVSKAAGDSILAAVNESKDTVLRELDTLNIRMEPMLAELAALRKVAEAAEKWRDAPASTGHEARTAKRLCAAVDEWRGRKP